MRDMRHRLDPWVRKTAWRRAWQPTQYSCLKNPMDRRAWWAIIHRVTNSWSQLKQLNTHVLTMCSLIVIFSFAKKTIITNYFANKGPSSQSCDFSSSHVWMWELNYKESWAPKNGCFWTVVLEKTLESPLVRKEIQPVHPKGDQSWVSTGRIDAEAGTPTHWPPDAKNWLIRKDPAAGKYWRQEEKGMTEDEMAGWHHWLDGQEFEQALGIGDGQGSLVCCSRWGSQSQTRLSNWTDNYRCRKHF